MSRTGSSPLAGRAWQRRLALLVVAVTFPLIWVGGLVTTYDAGMAVPDWPNTYGYNVLLYPWRSWLFGPWDLFVEHGHRLLGVAAGLATIGLVVVTWRWDSRRWARWCAVGLLAAVVAQGCLGGARVLLDERTLAMLHGCCGPLFFGLAVCFAVATSDGRRATGREGAGVASASPLRAVALLCPLLAYLQLVLGAQLRHLPPDASHGAFRAALWFHLAGAAALAVHVGWLLALARRGGAGWAPRPLRRAAGWLAAAVAAQLTLGAATYVAVHYWPGWALGYRWTDGYTITAGGMWEANLTTGHAAMGSLIFGLALTAAFRAWRLSGARTGASRGAPARPARPAPGRGVPA